MPYDHALTPEENMAQVYVNVRGGIAEVTVTRGDVQVIHIDWDNLKPDGDPSLEDLVAARQGIKLIADEAYRERLLDDIDELIRKHPDLN